MRHRIAAQRFGRMVAHRKAMFENMITSLFKHERIRTTKQKAKAARSIAEKMITRAKVDSVHNRRIIGRKIEDASILNKLFKEIAPRFVERKGGYTRIYKLAQRTTDDASMVLLELVDRKEKTKKAKKVKKAEAPKDTQEKA